MFLPEKCALQEKKQDIHEKCKKDQITLILSHVNEQPMKVMKKAKFDKEIGRDNFCANIDEALARAASLAEDN